MQQTKAMLWEERILALEASGLSRQAWSKEQGIRRRKANAINYSLNQWDALNTFL